MFSEKKMKFRTNGNFSRKISETGKGKDLSCFSLKKLEFFLELSIEIIYKKRTYDARLGEISSDSYGKSY